MVNDYPLGNNPTLAQDALIGLSHLSFLLPYDYMAISINHISKHHQPQRYYIQAKRYFQHHRVTLLSIFYREVIKLNMTRFQRNS